MTSYTHLDIVYSRKVQPLQTVHFIPITMWQLRAVIDQWKQPTTGIGSCLGFDANFTARNAFLSGSCVFKCDKNPHRPTWGLSCKASSRSSLWCTAGILLAMEDKGNEGLNYLVHGLSFPEVCARVRGTRRSWRRAQADLILLDVKRN